VLREAFSSRKVLRSSDGVKIVGEGDYFAALLFARRGADFWRAAFTVDAGFSAGIS
jgi:hypothetical protein